MRFSAIGFGVVGVAVLACEPTYETRDVTIVVEEATQDAGAIDAKEEADMVTKVEKWSATGQLVTQDPNRVVSLQVEFPEDSEMHTVLFALHQPVPPLNPKPLDGAVFAYAKVDWMVGGSEISRVCNLVNGGSISGVGQSVKITLFDATPRYTTPSDQTPNLAYTVTAAVGAGVRSSNSQPPTYSPPSFSTYALATNAFLNVPLPTIQGVGIGAVSVQVLAAVQAEVGGTIPPATGVLITQVSATGAPLVNYLLEDVVGDFIPLNPLCTAVLIQNFNANTIAASIAFGIDG